MKHGVGKVAVLGMLAALLAGDARVSPPAAASEETSRARISRDYTSALGVIRESYVEAVEEDKLTKAAIQGMLQELDPHSNFFDRKAFAEMNSEQRSHYFGIGAEIGQRNRGTYVLEPFENTPAGRAGLRYGDHIVAIDGKDTADWPSDRVRNGLRGERGTALKVTVRRVGVAEPLTFTLQRDAVALPSITNYYLARPGIGYIGLARGFHSTTHDELTQVMADLRKQGATSFVLDLRGNPGGYLDQAIKVSDKFLKRGQVVVSVRGREGGDFSRNLVAERGATDNFPLVILINEGSASASEIVAGAVQDHDRGLIVGETSFGKGLVQHIFPLSEGAGLTLTIAHFYTPSGRLIQRDYSNGSFYEYITRRNSGGAAAAPKPQQEERRTDLGRTVFGGGGIEPDIKVGSADKLTPAQLRLIHGLFMFTRELMAGQVATAPDFKRGGIERRHQLKPNEFMVTDETLKAYRAFMENFIREHQDYGLTLAQVDENMIWARKQIRQEAFLAAYGRDTAQRALNDLDLQLQRAIAELPNSAQLAEQSWRAMKR